MDQLRFNIDKSVQGCKVQLVTSYLFVTEVFCHRDCVTLGCKRKAAGCFVRCDR